MKLKIWNEVKQYENEVKSLEMK